MSMNVAQINRESGFTLVELLVTVGIAMFVLAGMSALFVSQTRTAHVLNAKSEILNDLFLASQMMQLELRGAKAVCWEPGNKRIRYQPLTSSSAQDLTAACDTSHAENGFFEIRPKNNTDKPTPYICWDKQGGVNPQIRCDEMLRGIKANVGMTIKGTDGNTFSNADLQEVGKITLTAQYQNRDRNIQDLSLSFKVWPRNVQ